MPLKDRFLNNLHFPIRRDQLSEQFIERHVHSEQKRQHLRGLAGESCELIGVVGRRAFHVFDKRHMTWICSSKDLGV